MPFDRYVTSAVRSVIARVWFWTQTSAWCRRFTDVWRSFRRALGPCRICANSGGLDVSSAIPSQFEPIVEAPLAIYGSEADVQREFVGLLP
jgi:hypothetical protein